MTAGGKGVVVGISGGVDSSVAAALLRDHGFEVYGVTLRLWEGHVSGSLDDPGALCARCDMRSAAQVARTLGIRHEVIDARELFWREVVEPFARDYLEGRTPNPCVECNRRVKFPALLRAASDMGAELVATGHYAIVKRKERGACSLMRASEKEKDQSYVLYGLGQDELRHLIFPNGSRSKKEIRDTAAKLGILAASRRESQEICFLGGDSYRRFLSARFPEAFSPGPLEDTSGKRLGEHQGIAFYTVGQRKGLGISAPWPLYVVGLYPSRGSVVVGRREEVPGEWILAESAHWIKDIPPGGVWRAEVMARYNTSPVPCRVELAGGGFEVYCEQRIWALTPGQHAVIYRDEEVLGGGVIAEVR